MRDPDVLYKTKLSGVFPDAQAIPASTETAKDGSPYSYLNINDLTLGWIQALFYQTGGAVPDGQPEVKDASQIIDLMRQLFNTPEFQQISASGAVVFGKTNHQIELDVSLGNVDIDALDLSDFIGQHVHFYAVGSGNGSIAGGNGVYVNGIFITENTGGVHLWGVSGGLWKADNGVTADYVSTQNIKNYSNGHMEISRTLTVAGTATDAFSVSFSSIPRFRTGVLSAGTSASTFYTESVTSLTSSAINIDVHSNIPDYISKDVSYICEEKY